MTSFPKRKCLMIGAGGMASAWIRNFFPRFRQRMEIVGLVDINPDALRESGDFLNLEESKRFTDMAIAFEKVDADFCTIVIPPAFHRDAVRLAAGKGMNILSEKPIADSWEACLDIVKMVRTSGVKMQVVQNYRYTSRILTVKEVLSSDRLGRVNYIIGRFADDYRQRGAWGAFRHEIPHSLLVEGAIHHFDQIRNLAGADCEEIAGWEWKPYWQQSFDGECCGLYTAKMVNGVMAQYEGNGLEGGQANGWHHEFYRVECELGSVEVGNDNVVRVYERNHNLRMEEIPNVRPTFEGHNGIIDQFLNWLEDAPEPETVITDNIKSAAMLFSAIQASQSGSLVNVAEMVTEAMS